MDSADKARADLQRMKTQKASIEKDMEEKSKSHLKLQESFSLLKKLSETQISNLQRVISDLREKNLILKRGQDEEKANLKDEVKVLTEQIEQLEKERSQFLQEKKEFEEKFKRRDSELREINRSDLASPQFRDGGMLSDESRKSEVKGTPKLQLNDKSYDKTQLESVLSPKDLTKNHADVIEGYKRLAFHSQVEKYKMKDIHLALFGKKDVYDKITLGELKESLLKRLNCSEQTSINFSRYLFEQSSDNIKNSYKEQSGDFVQINFMDQTSIFKITSQIEPVFTMENPIEYYNDSKEEKMKLIIGQRFMDNDAKGKMLVYLKQNMANNVMLTYELFLQVFKSASIQLDKNTLKCCFVYLLRNCSKGKQFYEILKQDLIDFVNSNQGNASKQNEESLRLTGKEFVFPREDELNYSESEADNDSVDKTYKPTGTDKAFSDAAGQNMRVSRESAKVQSQRTEDGIQWQHNFKQSEDGALKIERGFSDMTDDVGRRDKRSTIAQKMDNFQYENIDYGNDKSGQRNTELAMKDGGAVAKNQWEEYKDEKGKSIKTEESNSDFDANERDDDEDDEKDVEVDPLLDGADKTVHLEAQDNSMRVPTGGINIHDIEESLNDRD